MTQKTESFDIKLLFSISLSCLSEVLDELRQLVTPGTLSVTSQSGSVISWNFSILFFFDPQFPRGAKKGPKLIFIFMCMAFKIKVSYVRVRTNEKI